MKALASPLVLVACMGLVQGQPDVFRAHPAYEVVNIRHSDFKVNVGGMDWLPDGRLAVLHWGAEIYDGDPGSGQPRKGKLFVLGNLESENPALITRIQIADSLWQPMGLKVVGEKIYAIEKEQVTVYTDKGTPDRFRKLPGETLRGWEFNNVWGQWAMGLEFKDNSFYTSLAIGWNGGVPGKGATGGRGSIIRIGLDSKVEVVASGFRSHNALGFLPTGELLVGENNGEWVPTEYLAVVKKGHDYGYKVEGLKFAFSDGPYQAPAIYLPHKEMGASPSAILPIGKGIFAGQLFVSDQNMGQILRVFLERVNGEYQGSLFRFSGGFESGPHRILFGKNGEDIYVGGLGGFDVNATCSNWCWHEKRYGLQKLRFRKTAAAVFEMLSVRSRAGGLEIEFTKPVNVAALQSAHFKLEQYGYIPGPAYGGGQKTDKEVLTAGAFRASPDNKRIFIPIANLKPRRVVHFTLDKAIRSTAGDTLLDGHAYYTQNSISASKAFDINGCMDTRFKEYNPSATFDDGSCLTVATASAPAAGGECDFLALIDASGSLSVSAPFNGPVAAVVSDLSGKQVAVRNGEGYRPLVFAAGHLRPGIYILRVSGLRQSLIRKIVIP